MADGPFKLKLTKLRFLSAVDSPAQGDGALALLLKREGVQPVAFSAKVAKLNDELGLVFGYAFSSSLDGGTTPHVDFQDDAIDPDFLKVAMDFVAGGGATDVNHDGDQDGRVVFAWPLLPEINKALGITANTVGLAVAIKPSAETYKRFKSGELRGFSIEGQGVREALKAMGTGKCTAGHEMPVDKESCPDCGAKQAYKSTTQKAAPKHSVGDRVNALVGHVAGMKGAGGSVAETRNGTPPYYGVRFDDQKALPGVHKWLAEDEIEANPMKRALDAARKARGKVAKGVVLTDIVDGHQHALDTDDPASWCGDKLSTTYATSDGAEVSHAHVWTFDPQTGAITIGEDSGHGHTVDASVPQEVLAAFALNERAEAAQSAQAMLEQVLDGGAGMPPLTVSIAARDTRAFSTPAGTVPHLGLTSKENAVDELKKQLAELTKRYERIAKMSGAHKAHLDTLMGDDAEAFLAKSAAERDAVVAEVAKSTKALDEVVYTSLAGEVFTKRDDARLVAAIKRADESTTKAADVELTKRAESLNLGGSLAARKALLQVTDGIKDEKVRAEVTKILNASAEAMDRLFKATDHRLRDGFELPANGGGVEGAAPTETPSAKLRKHVEKFQADHKIASYQQALVKAIREDAETGRLYEATKN